jgi:type I restriction enzyme R subunit
MDFRNATDLFADPAFDGDPGLIKEVSGDEKLTEEDIHPEGNEAIIDPETGEAVEFGDNSNQHTTYRPAIITGGKIEERPLKVYVAGVDVSVLNERVQHLDGNGKLIIESLKEFTKKGLLNKFRSLEDFLSQWNKTEKKKAIIEELESNGIVLENLKEEVKKDLDIFDLICHIAWDKPALTRRERAEQVKKRNYFTRYGDKARLVLNALLDKYASEGIENIEELSVLKVEPFPELGTPAEIVGYFGGKEKYIKALKELEQEIYKTAA